MIKDTEMAEVNFYSTIFWVLGKNEKSCFRLEANLLN